ncbi:unnamed protein product [Cyclocybe aegerita]|uniref:Peptidase M43 pregnancy-associated plasma-A domain-containing protein n=1 Tax=Cyclocybe aegerita TaxID=1973307 RepID=A0A8S0VVF8_CYCAE|nr:unnamed protein product [Cyclocybe aegerita]
MRGTWNASGSNKKPSKSAFSPGSIIPPTLPSPPTMASFKTALALALFYCASSVSTLAPTVGRTCATTTLTDKEVAAAQEHFLEHRKPVRNSAFAKAAPINVYFHVVHKDRTVNGGFIPDTAIANQIQVLNDDYASTGFSFALRNVSRIQNAEWFNRLGPFDTDYMEFEMKRRYRQGGAADLNVYTVGFETGASEGLLGYAFYPFEYAKDPQRDGVIVHHASVPGGSLAAYNLGRTLTHEAGHWMGLYHTWQGRCTNIEGGDLVDDTPVENEPSYGCPVGRDTCPQAPGVDSIRNFMNYADDSCMTNFTPGQATRMKEQAVTYRQIVV